MRKSILAVALLSALTFLMASTASSAPATRNDGIYPPSDSAKSSISFDNKGFIIDGRHVFIASGSIHYARVPHELWADRLTRLKQASFNTVQTYLFWNFQEPVKDRWTFAGDADFEGFLETAQKVGLYATVRPGPYVCAEWDSGGYPVWLRFVPGLTAIRGDNPVWLGLNDHWYDKVLPMVAKHQINHGGNVVLVQLENEHPQGWGVLPNNPYFVHLHDVAVKNGIEVPHFMSGMHHGGSPAPDNLDPAQRATPWYSTEFWAGWFDDYRILTNKKFRQIVAANWAILAHGGAGMNYYMAHGGSNFDTWCDDSTGPSYDYGAAIGQAGDLRPVYYQMKRANQIAQSFPDILSNSTDALDQYKNFATGINVVANGARQSDAGTIVFLQNRSAGSAVATFNNGDTLHMPPNANYPFPQNATIAPGIKIAESDVPVLGVAHNDHVVSVIVYGMPGDSGRITFANAAGKRDELKIKFPANGVVESDLAQSDPTVRVLAVSEDLSLYTWILGPANTQDVVFGPEYVQSISHAADGKVGVLIERPYGQPSCGQVAVFGAKGQSWHLAAPADTGIESQPAPSLTHWRMSQTAEASPNYDDSKWMQSDRPLPMGADGDFSAWVWYRAMINAPSAGSGMLTLKGADNLEVYVNGKHVDGKNSWTADFVAGKNTIAIFASHRGRKKLYNYLGPLDTVDVKGLVSVDLKINGQKVEFSRWKMMGGAGGEVASLTSWVAPEDSQGIPAFYQATFAARPPNETGGHPILRVNYKGLSRGMIWVNGHSLGRYPEKIRIDSLYIPECWIKDGENKLTIFDETGARPEQVALLVEQPASREVIRATQTVDANTPIIVPVQSKGIDLMATNKGNLAFGCPVVASYTKSAGGPAVEDLAAAAVTDGDPDSSWSAPNPKTVASASVTVDLGMRQKIKVCEILFNNPANNYKYVLEGSDDGNAWNRLGDQTTAVPTSPDSPSELSRQNLSGDAHRYLRVTIQSGKSFSIAELRAFGEAK